MKRSGILALLFVFAMLLSPLAAAEQSKPVETIYLTVKTNYETAITDVASGDLDIFLHTVSGQTYKELPSDVIKKLRLIRSIGGETALQLNPVHDEDNPYLVTVGGKKYFNPISIKEIRFALNWLVSRQYIVNNIYGGSAQPMFGAVRPSTGAGMYFEPVYKALGFTSAADVAKAQKMVEEAMKKAADELAKQGHKLELKTDENGKQWWYFDGEPVVIKFVIRPEDERKDIGLYVAGLIEKYLHFKVEKLIWNAAKAIPKVYYSDPKNFEWQIYTAGWIITSNVKWPDWQTAAFYSTIWGKQPAAVGWSYTPETTVKDVVEYLGGPEKAIELLELKYYNTPEKLKEIYSWNIDKVVELINYGQVVVDNKTYVLEEGNVDQYWDLQKISMAQGIMDGLVVFLAEQWEYFSVNKEKITRIAPDVSAGLFSWWVWRGLESTDGTAKVAEFSQGGSLYTNAMNPIGGGGDIYGNMVVRAISDPAVAADPATGTYIPVRCEYKVERGPVKIPENAVIYNSTLDKWVPAHGGETAKAKVTFTCKLGKWHDGTPITIDDIKYAIAFRYEWSYKDGDNDPYYDEALGSNTKTLEQTLGFVFVNDNTYVVYTNITHPVADDVIAANNNWWPSVPWYLRYAMGELVANPEKYGVNDKYSFSEAAEGVKWLDLLVSDHVADLKKVIEKLKEEKAVPPAVADDIKDPTEVYDSLITFINKHGHAYVSNGPYYLDSYNPEQIIMVFKAFKDGYPIPSDYWKQKLLIARMSVTGFQAPARIYAGDDLTIKINAKLAMEFPEYGEVPADRGFITVEIKDEKGNVIYKGEASLKKAGLFELTIPGATTEKWESGKYEILIKGGMYKDITSFTDKRTLIVIKKQVTSPTTPSPSSPTSSPTTSETSPTKTGVCGPAALLGLALIPLLLRRRK